jgi:hypothetical protein
MAQLRKLFEWRNIHPAFRQKKHCELRLQPCLLLVSTSRDFRIARDNDPIAFGAQFSKSFLIRHVWRELLLKMDDFVIGMHRCV